ncbi:hypothetical protein V4Y02_23680, partial [Escherichia coli]
SQSKQIASPNQKEPRSSLLIKGTIQPEDIIIVNTYVLDAWLQHFIKQKLLGIKGLTPIQYSGNFNMPL